MSSDSTILWERRGSYFFEPEIFKKQYPDLQGALPVFGGIARRDARPVRLCSPPTKTSEREARLRLRRSRVMNYEC